MPSNMRDITPGVHTPSPQSGQDDVLIVVPGQSQGTTIDTAQGSHSTEAGNPTNVVVATGATPVLDTMASAPESTPRILDKGDYPPPAGMWLGHDPILPNREAAQAFDPGRPATSGPCTPTRGRSGFRYHGRGTREGPRGHDDGSTTHIEPFAGLPDNERADKIINPATGESVLTQTNRAMEIYQELVHEEENAARHRKQDAANSLLGLGSYDETADQKTVRVQLVENGEDYDCNVIELLKLQDRTTKALKEKVKELQIEIERRNDTIDALRAQVHDEMEEVRVIGGQLQAAQNELLSVATQNSPRDEVDDRETKNDTAELCKETKIELGAGQFTGLNWAKDLQAREILRDYLPG